MVTNIRRTGVTGKQSFQRDVERIRAAVTTSGGGGAGSDHGALTGLSDDDHSQYAHLSQAENILGQWQYAPASPQAPFTLNANAQGQKVVGLNVDELDGSDWTSIGSDLVPLTVDTYDLGSSAKLWRKGYLSELEALLFVENSIHVEGGWLIVGHDQGTLDEDVNNSQTTIDFGKAMVLNDFVLMRAFLQVEYIQVGTLVSGTNYNVTRDVDGSGANTWPEGMVFLVLGNTGDGRIELVANQNDAPRISILEQGATYNAQTERVRIGNMRDSFGVGSNDYYGFGAGDFSGGNYLVYNNTDGFILTAGDGVVKINDDGIQLLNSSGAELTTAAIRFNTSSQSTGYEASIYGYQAGSTNFLDFQLQWSGVDKGYFRGVSSSGGGYWQFSADYLQVSNDIQLDPGGMGIGSTSAANVSGNDLRVDGTISTGGGIYSGSPTVDASTGQVIATADIRTGSGLTVGNTSTNMGVGQGYFTDSLWVSTTVATGLAAKGSIALLTDIGGYTLEQIALRDSGVNHGMTTETYFATYGKFAELADAVGGLIIAGYTEQIRSMLFVGVGTTEDTDTDTGADGTIDIQGSKKSGTARGALTSSANILTVKNLGTTEIIVKGDGRLYVQTSTGSSSVGTFDIYDDIKLLAGARGMMLPVEYSLEKGFNEFVDYARPILEATGVIVVNDGLYGNGNDGSVFMQIQGMLKLHNDAIRQVYSNLMEEISDLKKQILQLEARNENHN